jgi:hypothetical protein
MSEQEFRKFLGTEFRDYKGQDAVNKLLKEKQGYVSKAFHRNDIGDIDLIWGNEEHAGLAHIIKRRTEEGIVIDAFLSDLSDVVGKGKFHKKNAMGRFEIIHKGKMTIISPEYAGNKITFVLTAFKTRKKES